MAETWYVHSTLGENGGDERMSADKIILYRSIDSWIGTGNAPPGAGDEEVHQ